MRAKALPRWMAMATEEKTSCAKGWWEGRERKSREAVQSWSMRSAASLVEANPRSRLAGGAVVSGVIDFSDGEARRSTRGQWFRTECGGEQLHCQGGGGVAVSLSWAACFASSEGVATSSAPPLLHCSSHCARHRCHCAPSCRAALEKGVAPLFLQSAVQ